MARRLWLHIGSHKTGTTTVQNAFLFNKDLLASHGLGFAHSEGQSHLHAFVTYHDKTAFLPDGYTVLHPRKFAAHLASVPGDTVFGSSENFSFFFRQPTVKALANALKEQFDEVRILAYIRRQDRHAISHHQEGARAERMPEGQLWGHALTALPQALPHQRLYLDYDKRLTLWENALGAENVTVRMYDRAHLKNGDIVSDILSVLDLPEDGMQRLADRNVQLQMQKAKVGHLANEVLGQDLITRALIRALPNTGGKMMPSAQAARAFLEPYRASNRALNARRQLTEFPDLFPDDFDDFPEVATEAWTEAGANSALRTVLAVLGTGDGYQNAFTFDDMRSAAIALKESAPESARRFAAAALRLRPERTFLAKLVADLDEVLAKRL